MANIKKKKIIGEKPIKETGLNISKPKQTKPKKYKPSSSTVNITLPEALVGIKLAYKDLEKKYDKVESDMRRSGFPIEVPFRFMPTSDEGLKEYFDSLRLKTDKEKIDYLKDTYVTNNQTINTIFEEYVNIRERIARTPEGLQDLDLFNNFSGLTDNGRYNIIIKPETDKETRDKLRELRNKYKIEISYDDNLAEADEAWLIDI